MHVWLKINNLSWFDHIYLLENDIDRMIGRELFQLRNTVRMSDTQACHSKLLRVHDDAAAVVLVR
jgi:hypothetical protein